MTQNENGSGSKQVQYRPQTDPLSVEGFFALLRLENQGKLDDLEIQGYQKKLILIKNLSIHLISTFTVFDFLLQVLYTYYGCYWQTIVPILKGFQAIRVISSNDLIFFKPCKEENQMSGESSVAESVKKIFKLYGESLMTGDMDRWISNWTDDCHQLPPGGPMMIGKSMLYQSVSAWLKLHTVSKFKISDLEVQDFGDYAYAHGLFSYHLTPRDGQEPYHYEGKFLSIFRKQSDGEWKLHVDCFNANNPDQ